MEPKQTDNLILVTMGAVFAVFVVLIVTGAVW